ncbi:type III-B CRISPR module RAMP protein Cmr1 [Marinitoga sp. 1155]|uniref:type III-B CRISPR module RAMP protein Cmr1 n=1 Tax=Marinitoga sp. 1155 TaxID=1428448 RepID=UPI000640D0E8|nr:type III-B CRISPR module RAMP protein Cmr1 [Marinitoga sp. 1155]KLO23496.1 hypothetical protein X274_06265 [Marinitoga sp. 1155]
MEKIIFRCEIITPMFCYGAHDKKREMPELRPPSIKGVIRFWWRAINGHMSINDLRKKEADIFGGSIENIKKSKISITIYPKGIKKSKVDPVPHKGKFKKYALNYGTKFDIVFSLKKRINIDEKIIDLEYVKKLFILVSILGGIGRRSRRGFGSFRINYINNKKIDYDNFIKIEKVEELLNEVNIDSKNHFSIQDNKIISDFTSKKYPYIKEIRIGNSRESNSDNLLKKISLSSHKNNSEWTGFTNRQKRLASPIYVSVVKIIKQNNFYFFPVVTILETIFENKFDNHGNNRSDKFISEVLE